MKKLNKKNLENWKKIITVVNELKVKSTEALLFQLTEERHLSNQFCELNKIDTDKHKERVKAIELILNDRNIEFA